MAMNTQKSSLAAKYGGALDQAVKQHAEDATSYGFIQLPGGIREGKAEISKFGFEQYKADTKAKKADGTSAAGEYYLRGVGIVLDPEFVDTKDGPVRVRGLQTSIMVNMFATKNSSNEVKSQADNIADVLNHMRMLAGEEYTKGATAAKLEQLAAGIEKANPGIIFKFSTSTSESGKINPKTGKPYPPRTFENWHGSQGLETYVKPAANAMTDNTGSGDGPPPEPELEGEAPTEEETAGVTAEPGTEGGGDEGGGDAEAGAAAGGEEVDLDALQALADANKPDRAAAAKLEEIALAAGLDKAWVNAADNWGQVVEAIREAQAAPAEEAAAEEAPPEPEAYVPEKGHVVMYARPGNSPSTKKPYKPFKCEVLSVSSKNSNCVLKSLVDNKTQYKDVTFDLVSLPA